jgi:LemA protein
MADVKEQLSQEGFTRDEVEEISRRAAELQSKADLLNDRVSQDILEDSAEEAGIRREFIEQAIQQLKAERKKQADRRATRRRNLNIAGIAVAAFLAVSALISHRALNTKLADVEAKRGQLENVLQRRHDLIPNLIALAKASAAHEKELITSIGAVYQEVEKAKLASSSMAGFEEKQALEQKLDAEVGRLLSAMRADPNTSSMTVFIRLSDEIAGAENRIAVERKRYNESAAAYNRTARSFPIVLLRPILGFPKNAPYFQASEEARKAPTF